MTSIDRLALSIPFFLIGMTVLGKESKSVLPDRIEVIGIELIKVNPGNFTMGVKNLHPAIEPYDGPRRGDHPYFLPCGQRDHTGVLESPDGQEPEPLQGRPKASRTSDLETKHGLLPIPERGNREFQTYPQRNDFQAP